MTVLAWIGIGLTGWVLLAFVLAGIQLARDVRSGKKDRYR